MSELLDRVRAEIRERLEVTRAAVDEYQRLEAALEALGGPIQAPREPRKPVPKIAAPPPPGPAPEPVPKPVEPAEDDELTPGVAVIFR
jgi:hypothetical protein